MSGEESKYVKINETAMMNALESDVAPDTASLVVAGATVAVIDAFDKKLLRDPFIEISLDCAKLQNLIGRMEAFGFVLDNLEIKEFPEIAKDIFNGLTKHVHTLREGLANKMVGVMNCTGNGKDGTN